MEQNLPKGKEIQISIYRIDGYTQFLLPSDTSNFGFPLGKLEFPLHASLHSDRRYGTSLYSIH